MIAHRLHAFARDLSLGDLPAPVVSQALRCLADLAGIAVAGLSTSLSGIMRDHAADHFAAGRSGARMLFDGRRVSPVGAALAGAATIDSFDGHDGHVLTKGHAGAAVLPGLLAFADAIGPPISGADFLTALVIGYEVGIRAGIATHRSSPDYHTSGSWNALGVVAVGTRLLGLDAAAMRHGLGIAEYHGPRSQMMRCIDFPTMVKDGSDWGAAVGVSAAYLARGGFTGAPALVVEAAALDDLWSDLGERWRILEMYFKPYPVCRWAQPAIEAALWLRGQSGFDLAAVRAIRVHSFHEAIRLDARCPASTEQAQYSLPYPVALGLLRGELRPADFIGAGLHDTAVLEVSRRIELVEDAALSARFPAERFAWIELELADGRIERSPAMPARGDAEHPLADAALDAKLEELVLPVLGPGWLAGFRQAVAELPAAPRTGPLLDLLLSGVARPVARAAAP
jgi:2-methylcitrate dehydratase PrpD